MCLHQPSQLFYWFSGADMVFEILNGSGYAIQVCCYIPWISYKDWWAFVIRLTSGECAQHKFDTSIGDVLVSLYWKQVICLMKQACQSLSFLTWLSCSRRWYNFILRGLFFSSGTWVQMNSDCRAQI